MVEGNLLYTTYWKLLHTAENAARLSFSCVWKEAAREKCAAAHWKQLYIHIGEFSGFIGRRERDLLLRSTTVVQAVYTSIYRSTEPRYTNGTPRSGHPAPCSQLYAPSCFTLK